MEQSSWAAAGMLAAEDPGNPPALLPLSRDSQVRYPAFLKRVEQLSGRHVPLRTTHTLHGEPAPGAPERALPFLPALRTRNWSFALLDEWSLDPRDLCAALPLAVHNAGAELQEGVALREASMRDAAITATLSDGRVMQVDHCVLATGAWSASVPLGLEQPLPVAPRKGQMVEVLLPGEPLPVVVRTAEVYLVPRGDGRIAIGATVEDAGFDRTLHDRAMRQLLERAAALWPPVARASIRSQWTGLRPALIEDGQAGSMEQALPLIGPVAGVGLAEGSGSRSGSRLWVATAHFRNGILLAPGTAALLRSMLVGESTPGWAQAYAPARALRR